MSNNLTINQEHIYLFVRDYILHNRCSPFIREIQEACNIASHKVVIDRLNALERKGYIRRKINQHRGIRLRNHANFLNGNHNLCNQLKDDKNGGQNGLEE